MWNIGGSGILHWPGKRKSHVALITPGIKVRVCV